MDIAEIIAFLFVGILTGALAGLLGIGGGLLFVPFQLLIYQMGGMPQELQMKMALGTSLASIVLTTLSSMRAHNKHKAILWELIFKMGVGIIVGAGVGAFIATQLHSKVLEIIYGVVECLAGVYFLFMRTLHTQTPISIPNFTISSLFGLFIGAISAMLGMGGGFITVPVLVLLHVPLRRAIGSSTAVGFMISVVGSIIYLIPALGGHIYPHSIGLIYLPAFVPLTIGATLAAPWGAKMAHELPKSVLKKVFAILLIVLGIFIIAR